MNQLEKHKRFINKKIQNRFKLLEIHKLSKLPKGVSFVSWTLGWQAERDFSYRLICTDNNGDEETLVCQLSTFLGLFILRSIFFIDENSKYTRLYP